MPQKPAILKNTAKEDVDGGRVLLAVCSFSIENPLMPGGDPHGYIVAFGIDLDFQRRKLDDGKTTCGAALLMGAFEELRLLHKLPEVPYVWATVKPDNGRSSRRLDRHGFDLLGKAGENVLGRKPGLDPSYTRDPGWSLAIPN